MKVRLLPREGGSDHGVMFWRHVMLALASADTVPEPVLDRAGRIARGLQAQVEVFVSLYEPDLLQTLASRTLLEARIAGQVEEQHLRLERVADRLRDQGLDVRARVRWDYPMFEGVIRQVLRHRPGLLIVPAIRTSDVTSRTLAYREARLIEACPCPLLLLKTPEVYSRGSVVAAVDPLHAGEVPQEIDEVIIGAARTVAHALTGTPVHLFHAVPSVHAADRRATAEARIREMGALHDIPGDCLHVEIGSVEAALPAFARRERAQVVVMGVLSRSFPERALIGHTAERVLDALACDVLVVKPERFETPVGEEPAPAVPRPT